MSTATSRFSNIAMKVVKAVVPMGISALLVVWLLHKVDLGDVMKVIRQGVDYRFIVAMMAVTVVSHIIRGIRWGIQLRAVGIPRIPVVAEAVSIFGAYALNLVFNFLGEAWRCLYIARRENCKLSTVVGTDLGDRASDGVMILLFVGLSLVVARPAMMRFLDRYQLGRSLEHAATDGVMWLVILAVAAAVAVALYLLRSTAFVSGMKVSAARMWAGFKVLFHLKGIGAYLLLTLGIWTCYFAETYLCFFAFPFTRELIAAPGTCWGLVPGLVVFVFGSCSMIVPSNGGLGPWNIAVMFALSLYGVSDADGTAYSLVCWTFQAATLIALGIFSAFYISLSKRRRARGAGKSAGFS